MTELSLVERALFSIGTVSMRHSATLLRSILGAAFLLLASVAGATSGQLYEAVEAAFRAGDKAEGYRPGGACG